MTRRFGWDPFEELEELRKRMNRVFSGLEKELGPDVGARTEEKEKKMFLDVIDRDRELVVTADLPGVEKEDIDLKCSEDTLSIGAEREKEVEEEGEGFIRRERRLGRFKRELRLPETVDCENVQATFKNGVLEITLPKKEVKKEKKIEIK